MPTTTSQEVYDYLIAYIQKTGIAYPSWYVGIASDAKARLFTEHNVSQKSGQWAYKDAGSEEAARTVEKHIIETHKTKGYIGGGDKSTTYVYVYVITTTTKQ
jgi:hypothetical protein